jgi:hypothetical protein
MWSQLIPRLQGWGITPITPSSTLSYLTKMKKEKGKNRDGHLDDDW